MNALDKTHWWQKKSVLLVLAGAAGAAALEPGLPPWIRAICLAIAGAAGGGGAYGAVEVGRAYAKARVDTANAQVEATKTPDCNP